MAHQTFIKDTDGERALLCIHGFLGSPEHFERFMPSVPEDVAIYNILLEGHGGSVRDFSKASMAKWKKQTEDTLLKMMEKYSEIYIAGHSMGTLFAIELAVRYPKVVKKLFLLQSPLKIGVRFAAAKNTMKALFGHYSKGDIEAEEYSKAHSVKLDKRLWLYIGWIPRYLELFALSHEGRETIKKLSTPCIIFQSAKDELVSIKSVGFIPHKENIQLEILKGSMHFMYSREDFEIMNREFKKMFVNES